MAQVLKFGISDELDKRLQTLDITRQDLTRTALDQCLDDPQLVESGHAPAAEQIAGEGAGHMADTAAKEHHWTPWPKVKGNRMRRGLLVTVVAVFGLVGLWAPSATALTPGPMQDLLPLPRRH